MPRDGRARRDRRRDRGRRGRGDAAPSRRSRAVSGRRRPPTAGPAAGLAVDAVARVGRGDVARSDADAGGARRDRAPQPPGRPWREPRRRGPGGRARSSAILVLGPALVIAGGPRRRSCSRPPRSRSRRGSSPSARSPLTVTADPARDGRGSGGASSSRRRRSRSRWRSRATSRPPASGSRRRRRRAASAGRTATRRAAYTIPKGTIVRTSGGTRFTTDEAVFLPVAGLSGTPPNVTVKCTDQRGRGHGRRGGRGRQRGGRRDQGGPRAVQPDAGQRDEPAPPTTGGTQQGDRRGSPRRTSTRRSRPSRRTWTPQFAIALENPDGVAGRVPRSSPRPPSRASPSRPSTRRRSSARRSQSFTLGLTATGTVLAVDASPARGDRGGAARGRGRPGYELVEGSTQVDGGRGRRDRAASSTSRSPAPPGSCAPLDARGARAAGPRAARGGRRARCSEPYGEVAIVALAGVGDGVPTLEQRVTLIVAEPVDVSPRPTPRAVREPTPAPTPSPDPGASGDAPGSEPVPSG